MDDEEEIHTQPPQPLPNGGTTSQPVTMASAPPPHRTLTLALPIQQPRTSGGSGGREDCWSEGSTSTLIDAWGERYLELSRGNLKQQHWKDVAEIVSSREDYSKPRKTDVQCKNRIDTLKKKYKLEKSKISSGAGPSQWPFFHRLDHLIGLTSKIAAQAQKIPVAIPVGVRSFHQFQQQQQKHKQQVGGWGGSLNSDSSKSEADADADADASSDNSSPRERERERFNRKRRSRFERAAKPKPIQPRKFQRVTTSKGRGWGWGNSVRELTRAILDFGEAFERAESSKLQQVVEMEKQRMKFSKEIELQRMQFFMKTQMEITQMKHRKRVGNSHHHDHTNTSNSG
ncbi:hypothetical protein HHK36_021920 [Tetracentron sinense]|uniref:Myb/SANT-like DNA-binding domain-containing protein n=1 Tax=Tetracentron sinense TaxID=13715 RepID=A0A834YQM7_TETSI|nr:hypothetical protein HHK36_021920 [Tetracentron sinense]